jgi:hypothetical protein
MYARVTLLEIDTVRFDLSDVLARFEAEVVPELREQEGYEGVIALTTPEGKAVLIGLWATEEALHAASGFANAALESFATMFTAPPGREYYEVVYFDAARVPATT